MPSRVSRVTRRRHDGDDSLHSRAIRGCISACAFGAVGLLRLLQSPSRLRGGLLARLSCSRVGSRLSRRRTSLALLVVTTAVIRHILAISQVHLGVCLWRHRPSSVASPVIAAAWWIARAPLVPACRLAPPAPSRISCVARRHNGDGSLHPRVIRGCISACAPGAVSLRLLRSSSRRRGGSLARLSRSRVGSRLLRRRTSLSLLDVTTVMIRCVLAPLAVAYRRVPLAPSIFGRFGRFACHRDGVVDCSRATRARVSAREIRIVAHRSRGSSSRWR